MDINKLLKNINSLNEYISTSRDVSGDGKNAKIQFNMSTVLALKKIRSYEIEYFNKYEENGIACTALQYMVDLPPSKTWAVLGKEIISLIQYWLDAIRKHLISHNPQWWIFFRLLLNFLKEVRQKDASLPNLLTECTSECLLHLASNDRADALQKYEILHCLNMFCAESNREIRFALRNKLGEYFTKLSTYISSCGHFPCQLAVIETLLRWLVPRHDQILRTSSAEKWFPTTLYSRDAVEVFLNRPWMDFFQDARDFLNIHNKTNRLIFSVVCRSLSIGKIVIISGKEKHVSWLDINSNGKCISVVLGPQMLENFGATNLKTWETLLITEDNTHAAKLDRECHQVTISVTTQRPAQAHPSSIQITDATSNDVKIVVSSKSDLTELDRALNGVFGNKYQLLLNLSNEETDNSTQWSRNSHSDEDSRFSHPVAVRRVRHSGYVTSSRNPCKSPSTTSTTSLAQLHNRLQALPTYKFDKEAVKVCIHPELSSITEVSETDDRHSLHSATTLKLLRPYGVCYRNTKSAQNAVGSPQIEEFKKPRRGLSPVVGTKAAASCLLVATIGSTDDSIISDTMDRLAKSKDFEPDNIVDLLVKEALEANPKVQLDSSKNTSENRNIVQEEINEAIENTPYADDFITRKRGGTVVRESVSDESNSEVISGTQLNCVNTNRKNNIHRKSNEGRSKEVNRITCDAQAVEEFFSQHFAENSAGNIVISPTLAKKINESSSETSEYFDERIIEEAHDRRFDEPEIPFTEEKHDDLRFNFDETEVIECLNYIVDKVCDHFDKYTDYLNIDEEICSFICDIQKPLETQVMSPGQDPEPKKSLTLKYRISPNIEKANKNTIDKNKKSIRKNKLRKIQDVFVQSEDELVISAKPINKRMKSRTNKKLKKNEKSTAEITVLEKENVNQNNNKESSTNTKPDLINDIVPDDDASRIRRKRKLYSPRDERINNERLTLHNSESDEITELKTTKAETPKTSTTFYKEIEKERKKHTRKSRTRKSRITSSPEVSPRTLKMHQVFDKLKQTVENNEKVTLVDKTLDMDVYNFTSESEDEHFKKKKIVTLKRPSTTTIGSFESAMSTRHGRVTKKVNYTENKSSNDESTKQIVKRKRVVRKPRSKKRKDGVEPVNVLEDERMRQAPTEILNTSIIIEDPKEMTCTEIEAVLTKVPELESIVDVHEIPKKADEKYKSTKRHKKAELSLKKHNTSKTRSIEIAPKHDTAESPLPGLLVESAPACVDDNNDSVTGTMLQKLKKIYQDGFDTYVNETNTTQNLLSDVERLNYSPKSTRASIMQDHIETENFEKNTVHVKKQVATTKKKTMDDIISLDDTICNNSEISIATQGINAHGDMDEEPPSPAMIEQQVQPRNLELEYFIPSLKAFFGNLRDQVTSGDNLTHRNSASPCKKIYKQAIEDKQKPKDKKKAAKVLVARLSAEDIDKWVSTEKSNSISEKNEKSTKKYRTSIHGSEKSPVVSVSRLSSQEIRRWLPSCNNSVSEHDNVKENDNSKENKGLQSLYEGHKWFPSRRNSSSDVESEQNIQNETNKSLIQRIFKARQPLMNTSDSSSNEITVQPKRSKNKESLQKDSRTKLKLLYHSITNLKNGQNNKDPAIDNKEDRTTTECKTNESDKLEKSEPVNKRCSIISPIKIGDFVSQIKSNTESDDDYVKHVRNIFSESERNIRTIQRQNKEKSSQNNLDVMSSPDSTSTKINSSAPTKRKSISIVAETKKQKIEVVRNLSVSESGPSTSSVNEWFRRNDQPQCSRGDIAQLSVIDCVQNVLEKLDTTLVDMNQNTSKQLITLFMDAQKHMDEFKERRRAMYRETASDMLTQIVRMMDEKFCDLDKRSQEMDEKFMDQLRNRASQMILEDSKQKQALVSIMKEDVQAVMNYIKNKQ